MYKGGLSTRPACSENKLHVSDDTSDSQYSVTEKAIILFVGGGVGAQVDSENEVVHDVFRVASGQTADDSHM
jgi:hypothetical protein